MPQHVNSKLVLPPPRFNSFGERIPLGPRAVFEDAELRPIHRSLDINGRCVELSRHVMLGMAGLRRFRDRPDREDQRRCHRVPILLLRAVLHKHMQSLEQLEVEQRTLIHTPHSQDYDKMNLVIVRLNRGSRASFRVVTCYFVRGARA